MRRLPLLLILMLTLFALSIGGQGKGSKPPTSEMEWNIIGVDVLLGYPTQTKQPLYSPSEDSGCCQLLAACN